MSSMISQIGFELLIKYANLGKGFFFFFLESVSTDQRESKKVSSTKAWSRHNLFPSSDQDFCTYSHVLRMLFRPPEPGFKLVSNVGPGSQYTVLTTVFTADSPS